MNPFRKRLAKLVGQLHDWLADDDSCPDREENFERLALFGRLAAELQHELKQPLTLINARVFTVQKLLPPGSELAKDVSIIRSEIKHMDGVLKAFHELTCPS